LPVASTTNQSRRTSAGFAENVFISLFPLGILLSFSREPAEWLKGAEFYSTQRPIANKSGPFDRKNTPLFDVFFSLFLSALRAPKWR
jgi:hypothetical protein